jgi:hypothetical protein
MATKIKNLVASNGTYRNAAGEEKSRWLTVGSMFQDGNKTTIKIDSIPAGNLWNGWLSIVDLPEVDGRPQQGQPGQRQAPRRQDSGSDDSFPPF